MISPRWVLWAFSSEYFVAFVTPFSFTPSTSGVNRCSFGALASGSIFFDKHFTTRSLYLTYTAGWSPTNIDFTLNLPLIMYPKADLSKLTCLVAMWSLVEILTYIRYWNYFHDIVIISKIVGIYPNIHPNMLASTLWHQPGNLPPALFRSKLPLKILCILIIS